MKKINQQLLHMLMIVKRVWFQQQKRQKCFDDMKTFKKRIFLYKQNDEKYIDCFRRKNELWKNV